MRIAVAILLVAVLIAGTVACSQESPSPSATSLTPISVINPNQGVSVIPVPELDIRLANSPDITSAYGEKVRINLSFTNEALEPRTLSPFPPEIQVLDFPDLHPSNLVVKTFPAGNGESRILPGESASYSLEWDQKNAQGEPVQPGWYSVEVILRTSRSAAAKVLVLPPECVMEKTIEVNQSVTVNGITILLEKVELTAAGLSVYAFNSPPGYSLPQGPELSAPQFRTLNSIAEYSLDGGSPKATLPSGVRYLDNGMEHIWNEYLDPVPLGSRELTFRIPNLGDWQGPWEFVIPLDAGFPFRIIVSTDLSHLPGKQIMFGIAISNLSSGSITIDPLSPAKWIRSVDQDQVIYSSPAGGNPYEMKSGTPFLPIKDTWDQKDNVGQQVAPGWYEIGYEYSIVEQSTGKRYTTTSTTKFLIANPDSAINNVLDINQSVVVEGVTVTLQKIEMNAVQTRVYTFTRPEGYSLPEVRPSDLPPEIDAVLNNSMAEYSIDGGAVKQLKSNEGKLDASGITNTWNNLDPIPVGAKEITFTITRLGNQPGRWEFTIDLS